jgi:hypothetical protein
MDAALADPSERCTSGLDFEIISTWTLHFRTRMILRLFRLDSPVRLYGSTYDPNLLL